MFKLLEFDESTAPHPATTGIKKQATSLLEKAEPELHNQIALKELLLA